MYNRVGIESGRFYDGSAVLAPRKWGSSYDGKKGRVAQETFTCLDADPSVKMKDTVDCDGRDLHERSLRGEPSFGDPPGARSRRESQPEAGAKAATQDGNRNDLVSAATHQYSRQRAPQISPALLEHLTERSQKITV